MFKLEDFGITFSRVTKLLVAGSICAIAVTAVIIAVYCLFGIGLARIAEKRGDKKPWYAYLPLLRLYTLGRSVRGDEKQKKIFACLLPSMAIITFIMSVVSSALLARAAAALVFAAEHIDDGSIKFISLIQYPITQCEVVLGITFVLMLLTEAVAAYCYYGAFIESAGKTKAIVFAVLSFLISPLGAILLYVVSREKAAVAENTDADKKAE